jgi:hypothetical protein
VPRAVEAVEKVPFQKLMFEKWDRNIEKRLVFLCSNKILAIFERVVGDFLRELSKRGVFRQSRWRSWKIYKPKGRLVDFQDVLNSGCEKFADALRFCRDIIYSTIFGE